MADERNQEKFGIEIKTDNPDLIRFIFSDCYEELDDFGCRLKPLNKETYEVMKESTLDSNMVCPECGETAELRIDFYGQDEPFYECEKCSSKFDSE